MELKNINFNFKNSYIKSAQQLLQVLISDDMVKTYNFAKMRTSSSLFYNFTLLYNELYFATKLVLLTSNELKMPYGDIYKFNFKIRLLSKAYDDIHNYFTV